MAETTPTSVRIPDDLLARVDQLAAREQRTRNNMVILLLAEGLSARSASKSKAS